MRRNTHNQREVEWVHVQNRFMLWWLHEYVTWEQSGVWPAYLITGWSELIPATALVIQHLLDSMYYRSIKSMWCNQWVGGWVVVVEGVVIMLHTLSNRNSKTILAVVLLQGWLPSYVPLIMWLVVDSLTADRPARWSDCWSRWPRRRWGWSAASPCNERPHPPPRHQVASLSSLVFKVFTIL